MDLQFIAGVTDETSGIGKVECTVNGNKIPNNQVTIDQITEAGVTFTVTGLDELQSYTIFVKVYDNAGNPSTATKEITGETIAAIGEPVITIENKDTWTGPKRVTIPAVEGYYIKYTTDGTDPTADTTNILTGTGTQSFTLNNNCTVKAVYYNIAKKKVSGVGEASTNKIDKIPPKTATISVNSVSAGSISVTATGTDDQSGVAKYIFQISATSSTDGFSDITTKTSTSSSITYSYSCSSKREYWVRVIVEDAVGNRATSLTDTGTITSLICYTSYCSRRW